MSEARDSNPEAKARKPARIRIISSNCCRAKKMSASRARIKTAKLIDRISLAKQTKFEKLWMTLDGGAILLHGTHRKAELATPPSPHWECEPPRKNP
jgi:hypothetical protein